MWKRLPTSSSPFSLPFLCIFSIFFFFFFSFLWFFWISFLSSGSPSSLLLALLPLLLFFSFLSKIELFLLGISLFLSVVCLFVPLSFPFRFLFPPSSTDQIATMRDILDDILNVISMFPSTCFIISGFIFWLIVWRRPQDRRLQQKAKPKTN